MNYQRISKEKIIKSAAKIIATVGLDKASVDEIVKKAGVSKGSVYFHFKSKDDLFISAIKLIAEERIEKIKIALQKNSSPKSKLIKLLRANNFMIKNDRDSFILNYSMLLSSHKNLKKEVAEIYIQKFIEFVAEIIFDGIQKGEFKKVNPIAFATIIVFSNDLCGIVNFKDKKMPVVEDISMELLKLIFIKQKDEKASNLQIMLRTAE